MAFQCVAITIFCLFSDVSVFTMRGLLLLVNNEIYADPYLNTDAGTMSPFEHGEVFVLDDGGEVKHLFMFSFLLPLYFNDLVTQ